MKTPEHGSMAETEKKDSKPKLKEVYRILHTNAAIMCDRMGETLTFYSLYEEERGAEIGEKKLMELGLSPRRENRKLFLTAQFSKEEIEAAKDYTTLIK